MNTELLLLFIVLNAVNVVIQTIKSLCTIKCGKLVAAVVNAVAYGLYTVVVVYMVCELPLLWKVVIVGLCNFVGVFIVKWCEEKARKDKLWKIEVTIPTQYAETVDYSLTNLFIPHSFIKISDKHTLFNCYCATQADSALVKKIVNQYEAKYFIAESKNL